MWLLSYVFTHLQPQLAITMVSIDIPTRCSKCLHEWVILIGFFFNNGGGESIMAICEFNELDNIW